jgi:hypothetical protein
MKRYNQIGGPVDMEECAYGYWVTFEDYNLSQLTHNKEMEKAHRAYHEKASNIVYDHGNDTQDKLDQLRLTIIVMSVIIFGGVAGFVFSWM